MSVDVFVRWIAVRLGENHVQGTLRTLAFAQQLLAMLQGLEYTLSDAEAGVLLPVLYEKSGSDKAMFREHFKTIFAQLPTLYPTGTGCVAVTDHLPTNLVAGKIAPHLVQALDSKNGRTREMALLEMNRLLQQFGFRTIGRKGLQKVARVIDGPDATCRAAGLEVMVSLYAQVAHDEAACLKLLGSCVTDKVKGMMQEKFKHLADSVRGRCGNELQSRLTLIFC